MSHDAAIVRKLRMGAHAVAVLTASLLFFAATGLAQAHSRHGARLAQNQPPPLQGTCSGVRLAAHASCVSSDWVNEGERWLIAGEDEAMGASLCVYLSRWDGRETEIACARSSLS